MLTYFRVLKRRPPPPALFPVVMEGLAKFVHLVNLETVEDLLDLLKDLLTEVNKSRIRMPKAIFWQMFVSCHDNLETSQKTECYW